MISLSVVLTPVIHRVVSYTVQHFLKIFTVRAMRKIYGFGGLLLFLPVIISLAISLAKGEGVTSIPHDVTPLASPTPVISRSGSVTSSGTNNARAGVMADIPSGANTVLIAYVDALTDGLHTGKGEAIRALTLPGCACRIIAESFEMIYLDANLLEGGYRITSAQSLSYSETTARVRVGIHLSAVVHVNRHTGKREMWGNTDTEAIFTLARVGNSWKVKSTEAI